ncbi:MAG: hypothetical protein ACO3O7_05735 [Ilumatobacteraceae bacterium]
MGDTAEAAFDRVYPKHHKLGLNRPSFSMAGMDVRLRYTPDRMVRSGFVEVMAIGHDNTLKIKHEKLDALKVWSDLAPVDLFVYHKPKNLYWQSPIEMWDAEITSHGVEGEFEDGKKFFGLHCDHFPGEPDEVPDAES